MYPMSHLDTTELQQVHSTMLNYRLSCRFLRGGGRGDGMVFLCYLPPKLSKSNQYLILEQYFITEF